MQTIKDFFAFRPAFTRFGLKVLWFAFLIEFLFRYGFLVFGTIASGGNSPGVWYSVLLIVAPAILNLILIRLVLEVAAHLLLTNRTG